jgi:hypothetical protein
MLLKDRAATVLNYRIVYRQTKERNMRAFARFILIESHTKEILINVAQIESIRATGDPDVCEIHMIGDDEEQWFHAKHTLQELLFVLDEAADVFITGSQAEPEPVTLPESNP